MQNKERQDATTVSTRFRAGAETFYIFQNELEQNMSGAYMITTQQNASTSRAA